MITFLSLWLLLGSGDPSQVSEGERWLREVSYIISEDERRSFATLEGDSQRADFIERFWRRRDPDPSTEFNPAREQHYQRLAFAEAHFGRDTDRARVWINYGKPQQRLVFPSSDFEITLYPEKPVQVVISSYPAVHVNTPEAEIWSYWSLPGGGELVAPMELLFMRVPAGDAGMLSILPHMKGAGLEEKSLHARRLLETPLFRGTRTAAEEFHLVYAGLPRFAGVREFYRQMLNTPDGFDSFEIGRNLIRLRRPSGDWLEDSEQRHRRLRGEAASSVYFETLEADIEHWFLKSARGFVCVALLLHLDLEGFQPGDEVVILSEMRRDGTVKARFDDSLRLEEFSQRKTEGLAVPMRMAVSPGLHTLDVHILDRTHHRYRRLQRTIDVPRYDGGFSLSDPVLCKEVLRDGFSGLAFRNQRRELTLGDWNPFRADDLLLLPAHQARRNFYL